jgi:hypothetical protein
MIHVKQQRTSQGLNLHVLSGQSKEVLKIFPNYLILPTGIITLLSLAMTGKKSRLTSPSLHVRGSCSNFISKK